MVKSTDCSSRGPEFISQQPHGGSQPSILGYDAFFWHAGIHANRILNIYKIIQEIFFKRLKYPVQWCRPLIPDLRRQKLEDPCEFKATVVYIVSFRIAILFIYTKKK